MEAIRAQVLRTQATPWRQLDGAALLELIGKALDPQGVSRKAREQLADVETLHPDAYVASELAQLGFRSMAQRKILAPAALQRLLAESASKKFKGVLENTERYGLEHRSMQGLTPLMAAASAGNLALCEALVQRGASLTARDPYGLQPLHHALRHAWRDEAFARTTLGALWELLAPPSFDVQVEGRLVQLGREQGEFIVFHLMLERLWCSQFTVSGQPTGIGTAELLTYVERLPEVVMRDYRRKRPYLSSMLSKNEASSTAKYGRKRFERRGHGLYVFNPALSVWSPGAGGEGRWEPIEVVIGLELRAAPIAFVARRQQEGRWRPNP